MKNLNLVHKKNIFQQKNLHSPCKLSISSTSQRSINFHNHSSLKPLNNHNIIQNNQSLKPLFFSSGSKEKSITFLEKTNPLKLQSASFARPKPSQGVMKVKKSNAKASQIRCSNHLAYPQLPKTLWDKIKWSYTKIVQGYSARKEISALEKVKFNETAFREKAKQMYEELNSSIAKREMAVVQGITSDHYYNQLIDKKRFPPKDVQLNWQGTVNLPKIIQYAKITVPLNKENFSLVQIYTKIDSQVKVTAQLSPEEKKKKTEEDDQKDFKSLSEIVVFEKMLVFPGQPWLIAGKVPPQ